MDSLCENKIGGKCCSLFKKLCSARVKDSLDFNMSVVLDDGEVCFDKSIKSNTDFSLMKTLGAAAVIIAVISAVCAVCGCLKNK